MIDKIISALESMQEDMEEHGEMQKARGVSSAIWLIDFMKDFADRKTENCSEKPNNCEDKQTEPNCQEYMWCADGEQTCPNPNWCYYAPKQNELSTEATTGLPGPCIGCLKEICAGCDFQKAKEAWRKSQADCGWK